jgi:nitrate reductase NapAB chaperone NapD
MPLSGLVVTFQSPVKNHLASVRKLQEIPEIEIGESGGSKLAIAIDSISSDRDKEIWNAVQALPGVIDVAVVMVAFDDEPMIECPSAT